MAGGLGAREEGSRGHVFAREKAGEGEGKEARSPRRKSKVETAWLVELNAAGTASATAFFAAARCVPGARAERNESRGECGSGLVAIQELLRRGGSGEVGAGVASAGSCRWALRGEWERLGKGKEMTGGPHLSAAGEREEGEGDGRLGRLGLQAESEGGNGFLFSNKFSKLHSN